MKKNILFLLKSYEMGGLEVVTSVLANKFVDEGHLVSIFAFESAKSVSIEDRLDKQIHTYTLGYQGYSEENVYAMRAVMVEEQIQIVINQWGLPIYPLKTAVRAAKGMDVKFISVYHNAPNKNGRLQSIDNRLKCTNNSLKRVVLNGIRRVFKEVTAYGMRWNYNHSDCFMILSSSFVQTFKDFTGLHFVKKLVVQTNPVTIDSSRFKYRASEKRKEVIFVGRLDFFQKKVNRVIDTWALLELRYPDWRLTIVGDGPDRENLEKQVRELKLRNVSFEGFQNPKEYYERASILLLTSEFEGFPLVLPECMSFGVIPAVYGSYSAVYDIVEDGKNGLIFPYDKKGYNAALMAEKLSVLMQSSDERQRMAENAIVTSRKYALEAIYQSWEQLFDSC